MDSVTGVAAKSPATSQSGSQGRLGTVFSKGNQQGEGSNCFLGSIVTIQWRKKVPESQTLQERLINILCSVRVLKLAFGECSEVSKLQKQRHM